MIYNEVTVMLGSMLEGNKCNRKIESGNTDWEIWLGCRGRMHIKPGGYGWPN